MLMSIRVASAATVTLTPGDDIKAAINSHPSGTTFSLKAGVYRMQSLVPKTGDKFIGQTGADLNGSQVVTNWAKRGAYWISSGDPELSKPFKSAGGMSWCQDTSTGCMYSQDLYLNDGPLVHRLSLPITSGQWYFDYTNDVVYMVDNPTGQKVELSISHHAFSGNANNVTVQGLIIEKYAVSLLGGAIQPSGSGWIVQNNEVRLNHGEGIKTYGSNEQVLSNNVHTNGEEGISTGRSTGDLFEFNQMSNNNFAKISYVTESGGGKFSGTSNARVINNTVSNNDGAGIWFDALSSGGIIKGNTVTNNTRDGIRYENSHSGTISNNVLKNNAQKNGICSSTSTANYREIIVIGSDYTSVTANTITSNCAGIFLSGCQPTQSTPIITVDDVVTDNTTTYSGSTVIPNRIGAQDGKQCVGHPLLNPANNNYFDYNSYHFKSTSMLNLQNWVWGVFGSSTNFKTWSQWRAAGQDIHGTAD
jgi:parallel beta-helix repeat protein